MCSQVIGDKVLQEISLPVSCVFPFLSYFYIYDGLTNHIYVQTSLGWILPVYCWVLWEEMSLEHQACNCVITVFPKTSVVILNKWMTVQEGYIHVYKCIGTFPYCLCFVNCMRLYLIASTQSIVWNSVSLFCSLFSSVHLNLGQQIQHQLATPKYVLAFSTYLWSKTHPQPLAYN